MTLNDSIEITGEEEDVDKKEFNQMYKDLDDSSIYDSKMSQGTFLSKTLIEAT